MRDAIDLTEQFIADYSRLQSECELLRSQNARLTSTQLELEARASIHAGLIGTASPTAAVDARESTARLKMLKTLEADVHRLQGENETLRRQLEVASGPGELLSEGSSDPMELEPSEGLDVKVGRRDTGSSQQSIEAVPADPTRLLREYQGQRSEIERLNSDCAELLTSKRTLEKTVLRLRDELKRAKLK